jgi:tetratricopeptide (TPR) repeat protein
MIAEFHRLLESGRIWEARQTFYRLRREEGLTRAELSALEFRLGKAGGLNLASRILCAREAGEEDLEAAARLAALGAVKSLEWLGLTDLPQWTGDGSETDIETAIRAKDFATAARLCRARADVEPGSDQGYLERLRSALCAWLAGDVLSAREQAVQLRHDGLDAHGRAPAVGRAARQAEDLLSVLDEDEARTALGPQFVTSTCTLELSVDHALSMPALRSACRALGLVHGRQILDLGLIVDRLEAGHLVFLEEERPVGSRLVRILGADPIGRLLLVDDGERPVVRTWNEQLRRGALFSNAGLVVIVGDQDAADHDPRFDVLDTCLQDEDGVRRPAAQVAHLAREAIAALPDVPYPYLLLGDALLEQMESAGGIWPSIREEFTDWYGQVKERFGDAEWSMQAYGRYLECDERFEEAGIAWSDAYFSDPEDERNGSRRARALFELGYLDAAEDMLATALLIDPTMGHALRLKSQLSLARSDLVEGEFFTRLVLDFDPHWGDWLLLANILEAGEDLERSVEAIEQAMVLGPDKPAPRVRRWRRARNDGEWSRARLEALELSQRWPHWPVAWRIRSRTAFCLGEGSQAIALALEGARRCDLDTQLLEELVTAAVIFLAPTELSELVATLEELLAGNTNPLMDIAQYLLVHHHLELAQDLLGRLYQASPGNLNLAWRLCRTLAEDPDPSPTRRTIVDTLLQNILTERPEFSPGAALWGHLIVDEDPQAALDLVNAADVTYHTIVLWEVAARALDKLDRAAEAAALRQRFATLSAANLEPDFDFLLHTGRGHVALNILGMMTAERTPTDREYNMSSRAHWAIGEREKAVEIMGMVKSREEDDFAHMMIWDKRWDELAAHSQASLTREGQGTSSEFDPWPVWARLAAARLGLGDGTAREGLVEKAGLHPAVRFPLALCGSEPDIEWLADHAPGALWRAQKFRRSWGGEP